MTKLNSECPSSPALAWEGSNLKGGSREGRNRFLKRNETKRTTQIQCTIATESVALHPEYCQQRRPCTHNRKSNPPLSCSLDLAKPRGSMPSLPCIIQQPLSTCAVVPKGITTYTVLHAAVLGTYAAPLRMLVRSYAWMYLVVCAGAAVPGRNAMSYGRHTLQRAVQALSRPACSTEWMCRALIHAAVCCACSVTV